MHQNNMLWALLSVLFLRTMCQSLPIGGGNGPVSPRQCTDVIDGAEPINVGSKASAKSKERFQRLRIVSQNCRGLKRDEDFEEMYKSFDDEKIFAACLQETWREGIEQLGRTGKVIKTILAGKTQQQEEVLVALGSPLVKRAFRRGRTQDRRSSTILVHV